jgi:TonB family protein
METVVQSPPQDAELHLLVNVAEAWGDSGRSVRQRKAAAGAILFHAALIGVLVSLPASVLKPEPPAPEPEPLVMPLAPTPLTQKAPNQGKVMAQFQVQTPSVPRPKVEASPAPPVSHETPRPARIPQAPPTSTSAQPALPEPPPVISAGKPPVKNDLPPLGQMPVPPPQIQTEEKPKLALEPVGGRPTATAPTGRVPMPHTSLSQSVQDAAHGTGAGGRQAVGDAGAFDSNVWGGIRSSPSPGIQGAGVELKSDAMGIDWRPYLNEILEIVRRNWTAVWPESVRMGLRGKTALQLAIVRDGGVAHLVYAEHSGSHALDEAAVAGVSASNPLPPLPSDFKGDRIVVQFNFVYNMPKR